MNNNQLTALTQIYELLNINKLDINDINNYIKLIESKKRKFESDPTFICDKKHKSNWKRINIFTQKDFNNYTKNPGKFDKKCRNGWNCNFPYCKFLHLHPNNICNNKHCDKKCKKIHIIYNEIKYDIKSNIDTQYDIDKLLNHYAYM